MIEIKNLISKTLLMEPKSLILLVKVMIISQTNNIIDIRITNPTHKLFILNF